MARLLMSYDRRIGTEDEREEDRADRMYEIAYWLASAAKAEQQREEAEKLHGEQLVRASSDSGRTEPGKAATRAPTVAVGRCTAGRRRRPQRRSGRPWRSPRAASSSTDA